ncbi:MAG: glutathione S-transferase family protein [Rhodospirillaceae bacterium]
MKLKLYYAPMTCALVPYVALTEAGAPFEVENLNTRTNAHRTPEFLAVNPKHKVPVLVIDGEPLTENLAIQIWIARQFPHARLLPEDPKAGIRAISLMSWITSTIHPHLTHHPRPENHCDMPGSEEGVRRVGRRLLLEDFKIADAMLAGRAWFFDHFTTVDTYFYWAFRRALSFKLDLSQFVHCAAHLHRVEQRVSVQNVLAHEKQVLEAFARAA